MDVGVPFRTAEVDGIPCFWADVPGPCSAGLLFRVGRADELLSNGGLTRLVERLALRDLGPRPFEYRGQVTSTTTAFYATGDPAHVGAFLAYVCRALSDLPAGDIAGEKRVLAIEEEREGKDQAARMLMMRFGAAGHGLPFYDQLGLRWLRTKDAAIWATQWFTRRNAALWMTCPPPGDLRLPLPDGPRMPAPEPRTMPALELPAYAASGSGVVASTMLAGRSAAVRFAARTVADRVQARLGGEHEVTTWQFPLTGAQTHRYLAVACEEEGAGDVARAVAEAYDAVAADGPTPEELDAARDAALRALSDDEAVPGTLDTMAVDELLGAPRRWKDDLVREALAVTTMEAAGALRDALATQLLVAPATVPKPSERLHDYPWFSSERVRGRELKPARRGGAVRVVIGAEGVSHVSQSGDQASTVLFADVAAALQESDGSLTLIGRDGAIVPIDPNSYRGAGEAIADLERTLPPEVIVPPRDALAAHGGGSVDAVAGRKLRRRWLVEQHLKLLSQNVDHHETLITMSEATMGMKPGVLALTDLRVIWVHKGDREDVRRELPYRDVLEVRMSRIPRDVVTLRSSSGETAFSSVRPKERGPEIVDEIRRRVAAAQYEMNSQSDPSGSRK